MMRRVPVVIAMLTLAMAVPIRPASADPIVITAGSVVVTVPLRGATGHLHGTHQFDADPLFFGGPVGGAVQCQPCGAPGAVFDLTSSMNTVDGGGTVEVSGRSFSAGSIGGTSNTAYLQLQFVTGTVILPPLGPGAVVSAPFELGVRSGLTVFDEEGLPTGFRLVSSGTATMELIPNRFEELWEFGSLRYEFQPVPEPATLLILGTGVFALTARRYRRG